VETSSAAPTHYLVLLGGVLAVASSSIMIRLAQQSGMPATIIAAGRLGFAALILLPIALVRMRPELRTLTRRDIALGLCAGAFLAIHFIAWISSLEYTSVASSVALMATMPLWVGIAALVLFRERLVPLMLLAILLTIGGSALIAFSDGSGTNAKNALLGDGLALLGALMASAYFLIGRTLRRRLSTLTYIWLAYTSTAIILVVLALVGASSGLVDQRPLLDYPPAAYALLLGLAVGPQLLGHSAFNWALRYLSATFISVVTLGEPIAAALLALAIFGERFALLQFLGFFLLLLGIIAAARVERTQAAPPQRADSVGHDSQASAAGSADTLRSS
jgi:drug/metabolite transporter (DMT)-like permease